MSLRKIGFIGLGVMGKPMAKNLISAGYPLTVWNRTKSRMNELLSLGAFAAESAKEVAEKSDVVIVMVGDSSDVEDVVLGPSGVVDGARSGLLVIDMSSISPIATRHIANTLSQKGVEMLDAPVSGGDIGAKEATLSIMVGGPEDVYKECLPLFKVLGKQITYMGESGSGQAAKLCNQVICAMHIQAVCEGLMFGMKLGLDLERLLQVLTAGYASSRILSHLGPKMVDRDFRPGFKMRHQLKDLKNALGTATTLKLPLPCTSLVHQMFCAVEAMGFEEKGTQTSILTMEKLAQQELTSPIHKRGLE
jgi:3-hydroxyisobutyrate dehydrogenase